MQEALYLRDCYLKSWEAKVEKVTDGKYVILDRTAFYPNAGGQPYDTGTIKRTADGKVFGVVYVSKFGGEISHEVDAPGLQTGDTVNCEIDWKRRYIHMRYHTASHVLSGVINRETGALITGNQIAADRTRLDFSLETLDKDELKGFEDEANRIAANGQDVTFEFISRGEALKKPHLAILAKGLPEAETIRVVRIGDFSEQACGGTHVRNTQEMGRIRFVDFANKGKENRRIYFVLE